MFNVHRVYCCRNAYLLSSLDDDADADDDDGDENQAQLCMFV